MVTLTPKEKEIWAGVRRVSSGSTSSVSAEKSKLEKNLSWSTYQSDITGTTVTTYSEHSTYLQNNAGFSSAEASTLNNKIQNSLSDSDSSGTTWDEYETKVGDYGSWDEWANLFSNMSAFSTDLQSKDGGAAAGIRLFESSGYTYDDVSVPAGAVEVFGREVHFSQQAPPQSGSPDLSYSNLTVSDATPNPGQKIDISADVTNNGSYGTVSVVYKEDGVSMDIRALFIGANTTKTVTFTKSWDDYKEIDVTIGTLSPITVTVIPENLVT